MPFTIFPHMLRHACGYALANAGHDTRVLQAWLGHKNMQHTVRYTELAPDRFKVFCDESWPLARLMVARFVVLAALIVVVGIRQEAAQQFMMGQATSSCGSWTEARRLVEVGCKSGYQ
jgi:Phage integrase family